MSQEGWTAKEKFILACCVSRSGDQNWMSVSRTIKVILEACGDEGIKRKSDFFSQKSCAVKYNELLNTTSTTKRNVRGASNEPINVETPAEQILRKLTFQRIEELDKEVKAERERYKKIRDDIVKIQNGQVDDQLPRIWQALQGGQTNQIDQLLEVEKPPEQVTVSLTMPASTASTATQGTPSRPQRASKETEKFKSYIEQRQKHNAKYHHTTTSAPTTPSSVVSISVPVATASLTSTSLEHSTPVAIVGPSPAQVQNMTTSQPISQGLLITKPTSHVQEKPTVKQPVTPIVQNLQIQRQQSKPQAAPAKMQTPTPPPTTPIRKSVDSKDNSFLSSLLSSPASEIKAQVQQINETLKEPIKNIHLVTKESYQAYKKAQSQPGKDIATKTAPVLSKLLEGGSSAPLAVSTSSKTETKSNVPSISPKPSTVKSSPSITPTSSDASLSTTQCEPTAADPVSVPTSPVKERSPQKVADASPLKVETAEMQDITPKLESLEDVAVVSSTTTVTTTESEPVTANLKEITKEKTVSKTEPLTIDVGAIEQIKIKAEVLSKESAPVEPPAKKRAVESTTGAGPTTEVKATPVLEPLDGAAISNEKSKKKAKVTPGRGSRASGRKKTLSGSMKCELQDEDDADSDAVNDSHNIDTMNASSDFTEKKIKAPLTPSIPSSPASPALSTGSNCDPETAQQQRVWRKSVMLVWKSAASHKYANVFLHPVTDEEAPGYSNIIYRPMDLSLIKKNIETGVIHTTAEFQRDIMLMFQNALMYNRKEHDVYRMAQEMRDDVMEQIQSFISTQMMVQTADRDSKVLRGKADTPGHTRQSSKSGFTFLSL